MPLYFVFFVSLLGNATASKMRIAELQLCLRSLDRVCYHMETSPRILAVRENRHGIKVEEITRQEFESRAREILVLAEKSKDGQPDCSPSLILQLRGEQGSQLRWVCAKFYDKKEWDRWGKFLD